MQNAAKGLPCPLGFWSLSWASPSSGLPHLPASFEAVVDCTCWSTCLAHGEFHFHAALQWFGSFVELTTSCAIRFSKPSQSFAVLRNEIQRNFDLLRSSQRIANWSILNVKYQVIMPQDRENIILEVSWMMQENCSISTSALCVITCIETNV